MGPLRSTEPNDAMDFHRGALSRPIACWENVEFDTLFALAEIVAVGGRQGRARTTAWTGATGCGSRCELVVTKKMGPVIILSPGSATASLNLESLALPGRRRRRFPSPAFTRVPKKSGENIGIKQPYLLCANIVGGLECGFCLGRRHGGGGGSYLRDQDRGRVRESVAKLRSVRMVPGWTAWEFVER